MIVRDGGGYRKRLHDWPKKVNILGKFSGMQFGDQVRFLLKNLKIKDFTSHKNSREMIAEERLWEYSTGYIRRKCSSPKGTRDSAGHIK